MSQLSEKQRLGQVLVARGFISPEQLERALHRQRATQEKIGKLLIADGVVEEHALQLTLTAQARLRHEDRQAQGSRLLAAVAEKLRADLEKLSLDLIKEWQQRVVRLPDREGGERKRREAALRLAMDFPRALTAAQERIEARKRAGEATRLRRILSALQMIEKDFVAFRNSIASVSPYPVNDWSARWQTLGDFAKELQRAIA